MTRCRSSSASPCANGPTQRHSSGVTGRLAANPVCLNRNYPGLLPDGDGSIVVNANDYTLTIQWYDSALGANQVFIFSASI